MASRVGHLQRQQLCGAIFDLATAAPGWQCVAEVAGGGAKESAWESFYLCLLA